MPLPYTTGLLLDCERGPGHFLSFVKKWHNVSIAAAQNVFQARLWRVMGRSAGNWSTGTEGITHSLGLVFSAVSMAVCTSLWSSEMTMKRSEQELDLELP